jgi:hypothetical protein
MHNLMMTLPIFATFGVIATLAGPVASMTIYGGAWALEQCVNATSRLLKTGSGTF